ncbi:DUF2827 domain-containing protein [Burkholderia ubonensis]|uniref:DUF2827 domain-containing protein n=1 Tax=Burkholderia ubonensis TaxID=101571 RepID=UPI000752922C|nr:DUF2827 domain-containing protein [Burkholderia ubonensis]KVP46690.1 hypothetical protein WJ89_07700 [Burkholderia ubonensis]KVQ70511.1 hypothetical protein WK06_30620 [Burkholderia ubonensis]KVR12964.1 hypothetical protein WK12_13150 [Burkholderia ubonensis]KWD31430.1 hypothetical protein WL64_27570 [Burkholderia ubonensis]KWD35401.1 hypothetical protein WL63_15370 [Burkholderia ubonensis]
MLNGRRLKVGVTIFVRAGQQSLWENGIFQNCFFLVMLLAKSPLVETVFLVNGGDGRVEDAGEFLADAPAQVIDLQTARTQLDVVIELSAQLDPKWARDFQSRGGRVVGMRVANDYAIDVERMIFGRPHGMLVSGAEYDVIWTLPAFEKTCAAYYEAALRAPVRTVQHIWSPLLVERAVGRSVSARPFGYAPGHTRWRLAILEPNLCMVKTSHVAMLLADVAYRQSPGFIDVLRVYNTFHLKNDPLFVGFATSLDLVRHGLASFEARFPTYEIMGQHADAIISHHWENAQNYLYYEALHGGYPLIHNSTLLGNCGYRYADFDPQDGALALRQAFAGHDAQFDDYRRTAREFLKTLDPHAERNVEQYGAALAELYR